MTQPTREGEDPRPDIQQAVEARSDAADAAAAKTPSEPIPPDGTGGENGAGGVVKNQDATQQ